MYETPKANLISPQKEKGPMPSSVKQIGVLIIIEALLYIASVYSLSLVNSETDMIIIIIAILFSTIICLYMLKLLKEGGATLKLLLNAFLIISLISAALDFFDADYQITSTVILDVSSVIVLLACLLLLRKEAVKNWFDVN